jgi:S-adenosylmethionine:diacylglycerol 3-amino-3-carboxypropyl transferase
MLYYTHVNEDCRPERRCLRESGCSRLVCIAGSGERVTGLLDSPQLRKVVIIDSNPEALWLTNLKLTALQQLSIDDYLRFLGGGRAAVTEHYPGLREWLLPDSRAYWDARSAQLRSGILNAGAFEQFLARIRPLLRLWLGSHFLDSLRPGSWQPFPRYRWQLVSALFSRRWVYRLFRNHDPAFVGSGARLALIPAAINETITAGEAYTSFMTHLIFRGQLDRMLPADLPPSMDVAVLERVQQRLRAGELHIRYVAGDWADSCRQLDEQASTFYAASDLLSFVSPDYLRQFVDDVCSRPPAATIVLRAFLRNRLTEEQLQAWQREHAALAATDLTQEESSRMYQVIALHKQPTFDHPTTS